MAFSTYIKEIRKKTKLTQMELANFLGISVNAVKLIESGTTKYPSKQLLEKISVISNSSKLDVITAIIYSGENDDTVSGVSRRFIGNMYLDSWNVEQSPFEYNAGDLKFCCFDGVVSKKRNPKNKVIITSITNIVPKVNREKMIESICDGFGVLLFGLSWSPVKTKHVYIVFDCHDLYQESLYRILSKLHLPNTEVDIELFLFDAIEGIVEEKKNICN